LQVTAFGQQVFRVLPGSFHLRVSEKTHFQLEFYTQVGEDLLKKAPRFGEIRNVRVDVERTVSYLEARLRGPNGKAMVVVVGWVQSEKLENMAAVNRLADTLLHQGRLIGNSYQNDSTVLCILHQESLVRTSRVFRHFTIPKLVTRAHFERED
jgi:hypothetical protein